MSFKINDNEKFWQDAYDNAEKELLEAKELVVKKAKKKKRKTVAVLSITCVLICSFAVLFVFILLPQLKYNKALGHIKDGNYQKAIEIFADLGDYKDSKDRIFRTKYDVALHLYGQEKYEEAYLLFNELENYHDSLGLKKECIYKNSLLLMKNQQWEKAKENFSTLGNYKESGKNIKECNYQLGLTQVQNENWGNAVNIFSALTDYKDSNERLTLSNYNLAKVYHKEGKYTEAVNLFEELSDYEDSKNLKLLSMLAYVKNHKDAKDLTTFEYLKELTKENYEDSKSIYKTLYAWSAKCIINNSKTDNTKDMAVISRFDTVYFHVTLSGGAPNATTTVKYETVFPGGSVQKGDFGKNWSSGSEGCTWVWFKTPAYADTGYAYIKLYDLEGNLIGEDSVYISK